MHRRTARPAAALALAVTAALVLTSGACSTRPMPRPTPSPTDPVETLTVAHAFDLASADPARSRGATDALVLKALYETALTRSGGDSGEPVPDLASAAESADGRVLTLTLRDDPRFANGDPVTTDDLVFSYRRVQGIGGEPAALLRDPAGEAVAVRKVDGRTVTLTSSTANPGLRAALASPALGVLDASVVQANGGSTTKDDRAEGFLNRESAGSGPYVLESLDEASRVVLGPNPEHDGSAPAYGRVVLQNVPGGQQRALVQSGRADLALDLDAEQVRGLGSGGTTVARSTSPTLLHLFLAQGREAGGGVTDDTRFVTAVRRAVDPAAIFALTGEGSARPGGMVPTTSRGSIDPGPTTASDLRGAITALNEAGYTGQTVTLSYPSDVAVEGVELRPVAEALQAQLGRVGITVKLAGLPAEDFERAWRSGELQAGLAAWRPATTDPSAALVFSPGEPLAVRAGFTAGLAENVTAARQAVQAAGSEAERLTAYGTWQRLLNGYGPFVPLVQPPRHVVSAAGVGRVEADPVWIVDLAAVR